jgi:hypothetical protein
MASIFCSLRIASSIDQYGPYHSFFVSLMISLSYSKAIPRKFRVARRKPAGNQ